MRIAMLTILASVFLLIGCDRGASVSKAPLIVHDDTVSGVRIIDIAPGSDEAAVELRWQYGEMAQPERYCTITPGTSVRIVIVEDLADTCGIYITREGSTTLMTLDVPQSEPNAPRVAQVIMASPARSELTAEPKDVLRMEWFNGRDPTDTSRRMFVLAFDVALAN